MSFISAREERRFETLECRIALSAEGSEIVVNTTVADSQIRSSTAIAGDGSFVVVWEGPSGPGLQSPIFARRFNPAGDPVGAEFVVAAPTTATVNFFGPQVAMDLQGNFVVTFTNIDAGIPSILARRFNPDATAAGDVFAVDTSGAAASDSDPAIAMNATGAFVISWSHFEGNNSDIYARQYPAGGGAPGGQFQVDTGAAGTDQVDSSVAIDADGDFVVAWEEVVIGPNKIYQRRCTSAGAFVDAAQVPVAVSVNSQIDPSVAMDTVGQFAITWAENAKIRYQQYRANGTVLKADTIANPAGLGAESSPHVAATVALNSMELVFVATWRDVLAGVDRIQALVVMNASLTPLGGPFLVNTTSAGDKANDSVTMGADGRFIATWTSDQAGTNDIIASRFTVPDISNLISAAQTKSLGSASSIVEIVEPLVPGTGSVLDIYRLTAGADGMMRIRMNSQAGFGLSITNPLFVSFVTLTGSNSASVSFTAEHLMPVVEGEYYYLLVSYDNRKGFDLQIDTTPAPTPARTRVNPSVSSPSPTTDFLTRHVRPDVLVEADLSNFFAAGIPLLTPAESVLLAPPDGFAVAVYITDIRTGIVETNYAVSASPTPSKFFKFTPTTDFADGTYSIAAAVEVIDQKQLKARGIAGLSEKTVLTVADIDPLLFVQQLYRTILNREAVGGEELVHVNALLAGTETYRAIGTEIWNSAEHRNLQINSLYSHIFGREADAGGLANYRTKLTGVRNGDQLTGAALTEEQLTQILLTSTEFFGKFSDNAAFVSGLYRTILRRESDAAGQAGWEGQLAGPLSKDQVVAEFLKSIEFRNLSVDDNYRQFLERRSDNVGRTIYASFLLDGSLNQRLLALELLDSEELFARF